MWDLPGSGIEPVSPALAGGSFTTEPPGRPSAIHSDFSLLGTLDILESVPHMLLAHNFSLIASWKLALSYQLVVISERAHWLQPELDSVRTGWWMGSWKEGKFLQWMKTGHCGHLAQRRLQEGSLALKFGDEGPVRKGDWAARCVDAFWREATSIPRCHW